ncbi:MAG: D-aminoacyl-tRNA deacylase [Opitutaceae bacterium]|nr:D-aminoacyl-tRNA deacylase [Opitutaceae bacterium]
MYNGAALVFDAGGRIRLDDREMQADVQRQIAEIWPRIATENLATLTDIEGYRIEFLKLFGFDLAGGDILLVSQFTLHASVRKGTRPSFNDAARPELAQPLYEEFILQLQAAFGRLVQTEKFGALLKVTLVNDGPVTILIDTKSRE